MMMPDAGGDEPMPDDTGPPPPPALSTFFNLDVAVFQSTKINLTKGGVAWSENAYVAENKTSILRIYLSSSGGPLYQGALWCDVELQYPDNTKKKLQDKHVLTGVSKDSDLKSTYTFPLMAADVVPDMTFNVKIYDPKFPTNVLSYPNDGTNDSMRVKGYVSDFRIQIVPVHYTADAMDTLPDVSSTQLNDYRTTIQQMYPVSKVTMMPLHPTVEWSTKVYASGMGWDELLTQIAMTRAADSPQGDIYYIGSFRPTLNFNAYCSNGCILGLSPVPQPDDAAGRVSLIVGYSGQSSADTLNHELGHAVGRLHAPCGAPGQVDPKFPYSTGGIGVWGYDYTNDALVDPNTGLHDFMSYCSPVWVSDYTYRGLYQRISYVRQQAGMAKDETPPTIFHVLSVAHDGSSRWMKPGAYRGLPGERIDARFIDSKGAEIQTFAAGKWQLPDLDRDMLFLPDPPAGAVRLRVAGRDVKLP
jgi:hypothetical protein